MKKFTCAALTALTIAGAAGAGLFGPDLSISASAETEIDDMHVTETETDTLSSAESDHMNTTVSDAINGGDSSDYDKRFGTCYEVFVGSFYDGDGDGEGDLAGLTQKLDYINDGDASSDSDLGCDQIWTMPIFPSPTYHKYDVTDYCAIDPDYGTMEDFDTYLAACKERGVRVILDLPINHTSSAHPWFTQAAEYLRSLGAGAVPSAEDCPYINWYNFSDHPQHGYANLSGTDWYYEARFWEGMPDLNLDSEEVRAAITAICRFWLEKGVYGFRLDAVTSYYTGDNKKNIEFMTWFNDMVKSISPGAYLVGEAWTDQNTYASYYASGIDSFFDFAFAGDSGIITKVARGTSKAPKYTDSLVKEEALYASASEGLPKEAVNAPFYTNHDMARSSGYYAYDDGSRTKLAGALNLLARGNAFLYYGEELGMKGAGKDENKRAPMQWTAAVKDGDTAGMCQPPQGMDSFDMKFPALDEQVSDPLSVYNYYRAALHLREEHPVLAAGRTEAVEALQSDEVAAFARVLGDEKMLVLINTSDKAVTVDLTSTEFSDYVLDGQLAVSEALADLADGRVELPAFHVAVLE